MTPRDPFDSDLPAGAAAIRRRLAPVLRDLAFPALRWQVLTAADLYGADNVTRALLVRLPEHRYHSFAELVGVLAAAVDGRTDGPRAAGRLPHQAPTPQVRPARPAPRHHAG